MSKEKTSWFDEPHERHFEDTIKDAYQLAKQANDYRLMYELQWLYDRIHVALIAAVYAGHIEAADPEAKFNAIGADGYQHREEYMNYAAKFELPIGYEGKIESDTVFNVVSDHMWDTYSSGVYKLFEEEEK